MKIGITSFAFRYRASAGLHTKELLDLAASLNAEVFQLCENTGMLDTDPKELASLYNQASSLGVALEVGISGVSTEMLKKAIHIADALGARIIRAVVDGGTDTMEEVIEQLEVILPALEKGDLFFCVENHFRFTPIEIERLVQTLHHERIRVCLDPLNSLARLVGPEETVRLLAPYAKTAHIKDASISRRGAGWILTGYPLGEGQVDLEGYLGSLPPDLESLLLESWMDPKETLESTLQQEMDWVVHGINWLRAHRTLVGQRSRYDE
ncbi:MAG: sugar phosphate isomerase/epimerase [Spirochaetes bacterium]|nr:sugar phosphate isomerase/epimerase [Spirochaetota bacterium]